MLRIAICDDDVILATKIESLLLEISRNELIDTEIEVYSDGSELWEDIVKGIEYDLIYLDIEMIKLDGIKVAKNIREKNLNVLIIYISIHENYFIELFEVEPFRFIKKPVDETILKSYFEKAYERIIHNDVYFEYRFNKITYKIPIKDILYFESSGRVITIYYRNGNGKFYGKMNQIEKQLQNCKIKFLRIHQSYLVSFRYIEKMSFSKVVLTKGIELQISEERQKSIRARYSELLGGEFLDD